MAHRADLAIVKKEVANDRLGEDLLVNKFIGEGYDAPFELYYQLVCNSLLKICLCEIVCRKMAYNLSD